jgi:hypothetical protein
MIELIKKGFFAAVVIAFAALISACEAEPAALASTPESSKAVYDIAPMVTTPPAPTPTPEPTPTPVPLDEEAVAAFTELFEKTDYAFVCSVEKDMGIVNIAEGGSPLSGKTYMGEHQYVVKVITWAKQDEDVLLTEGLQVLLSIPYKYGVTSSKYDLVDQPGYMELREGETYLIFAEYERNYELFSPAKGPASVFAIEDGWVYPVSPEGEGEQWLGGRGRGGIEERNLAAAMALFGE